MEPRRMTAVKVWIRDLLEGKFIRGSELNPSYVVTPNGLKVSRANIFGTVTDKFVSDDSSYGFVLIDDGSAAIRAKVFGDDVKMIEDIAVGSNVVAIGRVREYNDEVYINLEAVREVDDVNYELLRKLELLKSCVRQKKLLEELKKLSKQFSDLEELKTFVKKELELSEDELEGLVHLLSEEEPQKEEVDYKQVVLKAIDQLDKGEGVEMEKLIASVELPKDIIEQTITELLETGICFEPKPGVIKKVI